jgi:hypothetical protein
MKNHHQLGSTGSAGIPHPKLVSPGKVKACHAMRGPFHCRSCLDARRFTTMLRWNDELPPVPSVGGSRQNLSTSMRIIIWGNERR